MIKQSKIESEFRTTVVPGIVMEQDIIEIGKMLKGADKIALQQFKNKDICLLDKKWRKLSHIMRMY